MARRRTTWDTVAIVGVGLIGGSIGLALAKRGLARRIVGVGRSASRLATARRRGAVTNTSTQLARGVADAQLTVVCTPVERIVDDVRAVAANCPAGALITDVASTKGQIVAALDGRLDGDAHFVGSHPLAGSENTGVAHAQADLFDGRVVVLTPSRGSRRQDVAVLDRFWWALGAEVRQMSAEAHDRVLAMTSHLPHLLASLLSSVIRRDELPLTSTGWADTTRVAAGDPDLWTQILLTNRQNVAQALARLEGRLDEVRRFLDDEDAAALARFLTQAKRNRDALGS